MNNIINLVKKEFLTLNLFQARNLLVAIIGIVFSIFFPDFFILPFYMFTTLIVINPFYTDELSNGNYLTYSLPINYKEYILSKYIFALISVFLISLIVSIGSFIGVFVEKHPLLPIIPTFSIGVGISLFMLSITIPLIIKFGYKNISAINIIIMLSITFGTNFLISNAPQILSLNKTVLTLSLSLISLLIFFISLIISLSINKKKELIN